MNDTSVLTNNGHHASHVSICPASANLSDALGQLGFKFQTMNSRMRPVTGLPVWGRVYTVQCYPGATFAVEEAIEKAPPDHVLVIGGEGFGEAVLMGGLMSRRARHRGVTGAVVDGAVRDVEELRAMEWPVFASAVTPRSGTHDKLGRLDVGVSCGGVVVQPGDWIAGDEDGVVVVPMKHVEEALERAREIEKREAFIARSIDSGLSLPEAVRQYESRNPHS